jgi:hypothetical protein
MGYPIFRGSIEASGAFSEVLEFPLHYERKKTLSDFPTLQFANLGKSKTIDCFY